jgi:hypothetical protein
MPQKKAKKIPAKKPLPTKVKAPVKTGKPAILGAAPKNAVKGVSKNPGLPQGIKSAKKPEKDAKKVVEPTKKPVVPIAAAAKGKKTLSPASVAPPKAKKEIKLVADLVKAKGAKIKEVVLEVPAPKGVAMLAKEGKVKKGSKAAEALALKLKRCREPGCEHEFTLVGYCRMHYIKNWRRIKRKEAILASGQLNNYVEELVNKYPDKYLDVIRQDLASEKEWGKVVVDLELEATDDEGAGDEDLDTVAEGVRPAGGSGSSRGEFDDEGDAF